MKRFFAFVVMVLFLLTGCAGVPIKDDAYSQGVGYLSGKGVGYEVNKVTPQSDPSLVKAWESLMERNKALTVVPAYEISNFYNESFLILAGNVNDPYGLLGDLAALLAIFGGQYSADGKLILVKDVPMSVMKWFGMGYSSGKKLALSKIKSLK